MASTDARPIPIKGVAYRVLFPILDADGDLVSGASGLDSEVSKDCGAYADCTNEATEIGSSGTYYLDLTATEMTADSVAIIVKTSTTDAKTTPIFIYPQKSGDIKVDLQSGDLSSEMKASVNAEVVDALSVDVIADSIPTINSRPTIAQALYILVQILTERSISGTTLTINKPDGSTALMTLTLNDATTPTAQTRAT